MRAGIYLGNKRHTNVKGTFRYENGWHITPFINFYPDWLHMFIIEI